MTPERDARLEELHDQIARGDYQPDSLATARGMVGGRYTHLRPRPTVGRRQVDIDLLEEVRETLRPGDYGAVPLADAVEMHEFDGRNRQRGYRPRLPRMPDEGSAA